MKTEENSIKIKGSKFMYGWMALFVLGGLVGCSFLIFEGFSFESKYSLFYIFGGIIFFPIFLYLTLWALPGFIPGKILLTIVQGVNGTVKAKKGTVYIKNIRNIDLVRNSLNLINDIVIETFDNKTIKIRTYNLIDDLDYQVMVDQYIYPYMTENARKVWDRKVNLDKLQKVAKYHRQEQKID
ncbi:YfjD family protein [Metabacillus sp. BG109]|uniref:YfjD family protein n=1 Tax=Metabacillus bambusae TaxID=2795218 RepID=A0ABS3N0S7_9BACI|nr:YfjD family protein [Metabacillus bambusae]